ncbi:MAG: hypothetical protein WD407_08405 [Rhodospirillales bacterium]
MYGNPSLITRIAVGKGIGFLIGLIGFIALSFFVPDVGWHIRWGILLWYPTLGAIIGVFGVFTWHPVLRLPMPWWLRAPFLGAWMNFVLTLFAYDTMDWIIAALFGANGFIQSPFWFVLEGALVGLLIGYFATRFGGEGKAAVDGQARP